MITSDQELNERFKKVNDINPEFAFWYSYVSSINHRSHLELIVHHRPGKAFIVLGTDDVISWELEYKVRTLFRAAAATSRNLISFAQDTGSAVESWHNAIGPDTILKTLLAIPNFPEYAKRLIRSTPEGNLINWPLMRRDPQPVTVSPLGRDTGR